MTYTPDVEVGDDGVEFYDFNGGELINRSGGQSYEHPYVIDQETGERQYLIEETDLQQDEDYEPIARDEYLTAIAELYPDLEEAKQYALENWHPDLIAEFDAAVESDNLDYFVPMLEELMEEYRAQYGEPEQALEVSQQEFDEAIAPLLEQEPGGIEMQPMSGLTKLLNTKMQTRVIQLSVLLQQPSTMDLWTLRKRLRLFLITIR